jgi:hypothetical protein
LPPLFTAYRERQAEADADVAFPITGWPRSLYNLLKVGPHTGIGAGELLQKTAATVAMSATITVWEDLVTGLAEALHVDWALVGRFLPGSWSLARTLAARHREEIVENFEYPVESPDCAPQRGGMRLYLTKAFEHVRSEWVKQVKSEAFGEAILIDALGQAQGILAFAHSEPLKHEDLIGPVLQIFAFKAAVELEREVADNRFYRELVNGLRRPRSA